MSVTCRVKPKPQDILLDLWLTIGCLLCAPAILMYVYFCFCLWRAKRKWLPEKELFCDDVVNGVVAVIMDLTDNTLSDMLRGKEVRLQCTYYSRI
ncbi:hypothetical protein HYT92_01615 [Candidatus Pacearchaeota archaeon]|nr:hypothetical protein [Candidatus Pacearchaeota archaeon]